MRCSYCGLPLSPVNKSGTCPRCSAPIGSKPPSNAAQAPAQMHAPSLVQDSTPRMHAFTPTSTPTPAWISPLNEQTQAGTYTNAAVRSRRGGQLGFTIAGLCIITGALLLIFVYVISIELSQNTATGTVPPALVHPTSTAHTKPTATSPTVSPSTSVAFPGQQYISYAQMASSINKSTAQPIQTATTFPVGLPVYVTFLVHPNGQDGEVCLSWYLNGKFTSNYSFAIGAANTTAYSYTYYHASGQAYVELSWSNSADCSNALLAQHIDFTIIS